SVPDWRGRPRCLEYPGQRRIKTRGQATAGAPFIASDPLRSGFATLEYEITEERASALGRLGRRHEAALEAIGACAQIDPQIRAGLVKEAKYSLWLFVVQRETCGLNNTEPRMIPADRRGLPVAAT